MPATALELIERLDRAFTTNEAVDEIRRSLGPLGVEFFSFYSLPRPGQRFDEVNISRRVPPEWQKIYHERQYVHHSPAVRLCRCTVQPFEWKSAPYVPSVSRVPPSS
jgi:LuxR family quorum sensing-dependent transcriptional regulator